MARWDRLLDLKPVPLAEQLLEEASRLLAQELSAWPPSIDSWESPTDEARFGPLLAQGAPAPEPAVFAAAFHVARLELSRELEAIDDYHRNERWRAFAAPGRAVDQLLFLERYLTEQMLAIGEATNGRIKRAQLVDLLARAERKLLARLQALDGAGGENAPHKPAGP
jgi:hypothetical protein